MRILYLTNTFPELTDRTRGIFNYKRVVELVKKGIEVHVIKVNNILSLSNRLFLKDYRLSEINYKTDILVKCINYVKIPYIPYYYNLIEPLHQYCEKSRIDIVHAHFANYAYPAYILYKKYNIPYIITIHGSDMHSLPMANKRIREKTLKILKNAEKVIFVSEYLKRIALEIGYSKNSNSVIPNGVDIIKNKYNKTIIKNKKTKIIGYVGNLKYVKGADRLPEIFYEIKSYCEDIEYIIVGDGILRKQIEKKLIKYDIDKNVIFVGKVSHDQVSKYIDKMDVMVMPSRKEGWPCVVMEAYMCGVPVVGTNNGGIPEAIGLKNCIVAEGDNIEKRIAKTVLQILKESPKKEYLISRAMKYSWGNIVEKEINIYKSIIRK